MTTCCEECRRWEQRIEAAVTAGDGNKVRLLQKLHRSHLERSHGAQVLRFDREGLFPGREVIVIGHSQ
jgi:hypothetical protein